MTYREKLEEIFQGKAFQQPLFHKYSGGLRLRLSEGGDFLNQFTTAHRKGMEICQYAFEGSENIMVYLKVFAGNQPLSILPCFRALKEVDLYQSGDKEYWTEFDENWFGRDDYSKSLWHFIAYSIPLEKLTNVLWCAFASDFGPIKPRVHATFYLCDLKKQILVLPYDDRGMDIVGPNQELLFDLYNKFNAYLLDHDRSIMDTTFAKQRI